MSNEPWSGDRWVREVDSGLTALRELDASLATRLVYGADELGRLCFGLITHRPPGRPELSEAVTVARALREADGTWILLLTLEDAVFSEVFVQLCAHVYKKVATAHTETAGLTAAMACFNEWRELFQSKRSKRLSMEQCRGLFAELSFGFTVAARRVGASRALECWEGPFGADQDFVFLDAQFEVKSRHANSRAVQISSEYQLEGENVVLVVVEVVDSSHALPGFISLAEIAREVRSMVSDDSEALRNLDLAFEELRFDSGDDFYEEIYFVCRSYDYFSVEPGFPRITPTMLTPGVTRVSYKIELDGLPKYSITEESALDKINSQGD